MTTMQTPTLSQFKAFSLDVAPAARAVLMARAHAELERERVDAYIRPIFDSYKFTYGAIAHGREGLIPDPAHLYLCDDEPMLAAFYEDCDAAHRAHGFTGKKGFCPALVAESMVCTVENALIQLAAPMFGVEVHQLTIENRAKYLDLLIGSALKAEQDAGR